jgi:hypothetical protein
MVLRCIPYYIRYHTTCGFRQEGLADMQKPIKAAKIEETKNVTGFAGHQARQNLVKL